MAGPRDLWTYDDGAARIELVLNACDMDVDARSRSESAEHIRLLLWRFQYGDPAARRVVPAIYARLRGESPLAVQEVARQLDLGSTRNAQNFGPEFSPTAAGNDKGYVDYHRIQSHSAPHWYSFSSEIFVFTRSMVPNQPPFTTLSFDMDDNSKILFVRRTTIAFPKLTAKPNLVTAGMNGHLYELTDTANASWSKGIYVQQDQRVFQMQRDASGHFTVRGSEVVGPTDLSL